MQELRANTQVKVVIGPVVAVGDGFTPVTTLDLSTADEAEILKHDAAAVTSISAATFAAITSADGYYNLTITTSLSDTEGLLTVLINDDSLCLPVKQCFMVLSEAAWDSKYVAKDDGFMDVNIKTIGRADTQETEASNLESACANYSATRGLTGTALPAAAADAAGGLIISDAGGLDADAQLVTKINDILTDTGTTLQAELDGIQADTEDIQSRLPAALTGDGNIKADALKFEGADPTDTIDARLAAYDPPTRAELTSDINSVLLRLRGIVMHQGTIGDTGNDSTHLHLEGLTYGDDEINDHLLVIFDNSTSEYHARWITDWADTGDLATVGTLPFTPENDTDLYWLTSIRQDVTGGSGPSAADIADAVWDEVASGHTTNGTYGKAFTGATAVYLASGIAGTINTLDALDTAQDSQHSTTQTYLTNNLGAAGAAATEAGGTGDHLTALSVTLKDGVTHGGTTALLRLGSSSSTPALYVTNSGGTAARFEASSGNNYGFRIDGAGSNAALYAVGGSGGQGILAVGTNNHGFQCHVASGSNASGFSASTSASGTSYGIDTATMRVTTSSIAWNAAWDAEVQSEVEDGLNNLGFTTTVSGRIDAAISTRSAHSAADVWAVGTRSLTVLDEDSTTLDLDATIRAAVGLASANLDTQLGDLPTNAELATALGTADDAVLTAIAALSIPTSTAIADAVLSRNVSNVEGSAGEHTLCTIILAGLESSISGTTLVIKRTDGTTTHATKTLTKTSGDDPIRGIS